MSNEKETILIVEDDAQIRNFISYILQKEGFKYHEATSGGSAMAILVSQKIDLVLLDLGLPDIDGMDIIRKVREWSNVPIIVVSARDQDKEKVDALDLGADDYLTKPFSANELLARIRVAFRHLSQKEQTQPKKILTVKDLTIDFEKRLVFIKDEPLHLTPLEYSLLSLLFKNIGKVLTTKFIINEIYGIAYGTDTQALRALMAGLRRKIEPVPAKPIYIITEIGVGYRLVN